MQQYEGYYGQAEMVFEIRLQGERLTAVFSGVPAAFASILHPQAAAHTFTVEGGPAHQSTAVFQFDDDGVAVTGLQIDDDYLFARLAEPPASSPTPTGQGLAAPVLALDEAKEAAFAALVAQIVAQGDGRLLDYTLPYPKHEFLQYAALQDQFIFHGSAKPDIDEFHTRRTSMELNDKSGRGNVQGIYGTHDGLWPLFFAVVDRGKISGSIRNGFDTFWNAAGEKMTVYHFSINKEWLDKAPWRSGTLYLLPRATFRRMPTSSGSNSNEWVSETAVKPLARLTIEPEDFPFLHQIGGHDDSELLRLNALGKQVMATAVAFEADADQISMKLPYSDAVGKLLFEYIPLAQKFIPMGRYVLRFEPEDGCWFDFAGPPAVMQVMRDRVAALDAKANP